MALEPHIEKPDDSAAFQKLKITGQVPTASRRRLPRRPRHRDDAHPRKKPAPATNAHHRATGRAAAPQRHRRPRAT